MVRAVNALPYACSNEWDRGEVDQADVRIAIARCPNSTFHRVQVKSPSSDMVRRAQGGLHLVRGNIPRHVPLTFVFPITAIIHRESSSAVLTFPTVMVEKLYPGDTRT